MPIFGSNIERMKEKGDIQGLLRELKNRDIRRRVEVVKALTAIGHLEGLRHATSNDSREVRIHATAALGELRSLDALTQTLLTSDKPEIHVTAAQALKSIGTRDAIDRLAQVFLKSDRQGVRLASAEALKSIGSKEAMEALIQQLASMIRLGDPNDQIEAMIVMQGRFHPDCVEEQFIAELHKISQNVQESIELHWVQGLLDEVIEAGKHPVSKWVALLTLVELGDRRDEVLKELVKHSSSYTKACDRRIEAEPETTHDVAASIVLAHRTNHLIEETMRALAAFRGNATATQMVMRVLEGHLLRGICSDSYLHRSYEENAICALGALGDPEAYQRLEYLAARGTGSVRRCAEVALANIGQATYDEIKAKVELK